MIHIVYADELNKLGELGHSMFCDRAWQFRERLGWDVHVDANGHEKDAYDARNPIYLILSDASGGHRGSARFLPTTEPVMVNECFATKTGVEIRSPFVWECTRFCLSPSADEQDSSRLLLGVLELGLMFDLNFFVGVFDNTMLRVYKKIGWSPEVLGFDRAGRKGVSVGLWRVAEDQKERFALRLDLSPGWEIRTVGETLPQHLGYGALSKAG